MDDWQRFGWLIRVCQPNEQAPALVDRSVVSRHVAAGYQAIRGKAAPTPMVFNLLNVVSAQPLFRYNWVTLRTLCSSDAHLMWNISRKNQEELLVTVRVLYLLRMLLVLVSSGLER